MNKKVKCILIITIVLIVIRSAYCVYVYNFKYSEWKNNVITIKVEAIEKIDDEAVTYIVKYNRDKFLLYIKDKEKIYEYGDILKILSSNYKIEKAGNPYEFNYKRYLYSKGIVSRIYCVKVLEEDKKVDLMSVVHYIRKRISEKLDKSLTAQNANLLKSIIYGDDTYLQEDIKNKFSNIGLGHVLCVSGTHIAFLLSSLDIILQEKKHKKLKTILMIYLYAISLFNISLFRAICMYILGKIPFKEKYCITLGIVILINPYYIFNIGIIFSFLSILGIHLFYNLIISYIMVKFKLKKSNIIVNSISLTISSQILTLPFLVYYFQKITLIAVFSNIALYIVLNVVFLIGFMLFVLFFIPVISNFLIFICNIFLNVLVYQVDVIDKFNFFNINLPKINIIVFIAYYSVVVIYMYGAKIKFISWKNRKTVEKVQKLIVSFSVIYCILWYIYTMYFEKYVIFFNVGQGNMAFIHKYNTNIIVDIGSTRENNAASIILNFLKAKNINKINAIFLTHIHSDHINGVEEVVSNIKVDRVCYCLPPESNTDYENMVRTLKSKNITIDILKEEDTININNINIDVLSPPKEYIIQDEDILNANSSVYLVSEDNKNILFMGDATKKTEKYILDKYINLKFGVDTKKEEIKSKIKNLIAYQVSHHGSKTSSYEPFINKINCTNAVISANKKVYGHPDKETLDTLVKNKFKIHITQEEGAIKF